MLRSIIVLVHESQLSVIYIFWLLQHLPTFFYRSWRAVHDQASVDGSKVTSLTLLSFLYLSSSNLILLQYVDGQELDNTFKRIRNWPLSLVTFRICSSFRDSAGDRETFLWTGCRSHIFVLRELFYLSSSRLLFPYSRLLLQSYNLCCNRRHYTKDA